MASFPQRLTEAQLAQRIDALTYDSGGGSRWHERKAVLTVRFETARAGDFPWSDVGGIAGWTQAERKIVLKALNAYEAVLNVDFRLARGAGDADMSFYQATDLGSSASGRGRYRTDGVDWDGSVVIRKGVINYDLVLHEIGHALGLKHPGAYDVNPNNAPPGPYLPDREDNEHLTVMSYDPSPLGADDSTLRIYDIAALQQRWGGAEDAGAGKSVYRSPGQWTTEVIWDVGGRDVIEGEAGRDAIDLREGAFSSLGGGRLNLSVAYGVRIEDARGGGGNDLLTGNAAANRLKGEAGDDRLLGAGGADRLLGGAGDDWLDGGAGRDRLAGGAGADQFVIRADQGRDVIEDFGPGDVIVFDGPRRYKQLDFEETRRGVEIRAEGVELLLKGADLADLDRDSFDYL